MTAASVANAVAAAITENMKNIMFVTPVAKNSCTPGADSARAIARSHASRSSDRESFLDSAALSREPEM